VQGIRGKEVRERSFIADMAGANKLDTGSKYGVQSPEMTGTKIQGSNIIVEINIQEVP
jgi:hypothetical protein